MNIQAGLCATCVHQRIVRSRRGSTFLLCGLSQSDPRFARYPRLPVLTCDGFRAATGDPGYRQDATTSMEDHD